ncbi:MAG: TRZ/ATZ family hydrolase [Pseudomonadota bacterium]
MTGKVALRPDWVVPVQPEGQVLEAHAVVVEGERIAAIVPDSELEQRFPGVASQALPGCVLIPGLINAHAHSAMALMRGLADDLPLMRWLEDHIWPAEQQWVGPEFVKAGSELAIAEMLAGGTTCFNDNYFFPGVTADCAVRAGMRAVVGMPMIRFPTAWASSEAEYFEKGLEVHDRLVDERLVSTTFVPHAPYTVTDSAFERMRGLADELDIPIHLHLLEAEGEVEGSMKEYGEHPLERLSRLGLLNSRLLAVHMTQLTDEDMDRVAEAGAHVLHCPASNLKLASGFCPVAALDQRGVNVAIGTDGAASNNTLDMFAEMRLAALLAKGYSGDPEAVPAARALSMATINGARALRQADRIGSIEPGKQADLVAVRLDDLQTSPIHSVISQLVYACSSRQVEQAWVAGQTVHANGQATRLDVEQLAFQTRQWQSRIQNG